MSAPAAAMFTGEDLAQVAVLSQMLDRLRRHAHARECERLPTNRERTEIAALEWALRRLGVPLVVTPAAPARPSRR